MKIGIIGGTDGLGKTLIYYFKDEFDVLISGRDHIKGQKVASEVGVSYIESNKELASLSDIVIVSVPIQFTKEVIKEVSSNLKKGSLLCDVTSVKEEPLEAMIEFLPKNVEFIPTHPIFGPRTTELDNQVIVLTPKEKGNWYPKVFNYLESKNMRVIETTASHHDYMMSIVQVLTHFSYISTASAFEKLKVNIKETEDYESPIYNLLIDTIARIVSQNPFLTYYIQTKNNNGELIRNTFAEAVLELKDVINNGKEEEFVDIAIKATKNMGDIQGALGRSDKAINSLSHEYSLLNQSIGQEVGLKHIYSGKVHTGTLKCVQKNTALLDNNKRLKVANIEILSENELYEWKKANLKNITEDISCIFLENVDSEVILETIKGLYNIIDVKLTDSYKGPQIKENYISLTFSVQALDKKAINSVIKLIEGFGGEIRG